jgi:predicted membrane chloride channel (bestrophin family)
VKQYLVIINYRTWIAMSIALVVPYLAFRYHIDFDMDLTLISIAIIFPLVFTIRGSFRRREKALEHLSEFRSTLKTFSYFLMSNAKLTEEDKTEVERLMVSLSNTLMSHLKSNDTGTEDIDRCMQNLYDYIQSMEDKISNKSGERLFRIMKDLHETIENVHAINIHRTPISLKAYCLIFIYIFPLIYAPTIIHRVGPDKGEWITYFILLVSQFILISLYNIQNQLEYPFDEEGMDDIKLDNFRIDR